METQNNLRIFLVDDDLTYRNNCAHYLKTLGYTDLTEFTDGQQCINNLKQAPDVILLDHEMLPMNGIDILRKIKRFDQNIFVIYLSGNLDVAINALKYGAFDYVIKGSVNERARVAEVIRKILDARSHITTKAPGKWRRFLSSIIL